MNIQMIGCPTVQELETPMLEELEKFKLDRYRIVSFLGDIAGRIRKELPSLGVIDTEIKEYLSQNPEKAKDFLLELRRIPQLFRYVIEVVIPSDNVDKWFNDKEAFYLKSPLEYISELDSPKLASNIELIVNGIGGVVAFVTTGPLPSREDLTYLTRLAQYEQLVQQGE